MFVHESMSSNPRKYAPGHNRLHLRHSRHRILHLPHRTLRLRTHDSSDQPCQDPASCVAAQSDLAPQKVRNAEIDEITSVGSRPDLSTALKIIFKEALRRAAIIVPYVPIIAIFCVPQHSITAYVRRWRSRYHGSGAVQYFVLNRTEGNSIHVLNKLLQKLFARSAVFFERLRLER